MYRTYLTHARFTKPNNGHEIRDKRREKNSIKCKACSSASNEKKKNEKNEKKSKSVSWIRRPRALQHSTAQKHHLRTRQGERCTPNQRRITATFLPLPPGPSFSLSSLHRVPARFCSAPENGMQSAIMFDPASVVVVVSKPHSMTVQVASSFSCEYSIPPNWFHQSNPPLIWPTEKGLKISTCPGRSC